MKNKFLKILYDHWLKIFGIIVIAELPAIVKYWNLLINHPAGWIILFLSIAILAILVIFGIKKFKEPKPKGYLKENLSCKEKFDKEVWDVLQKIKANVFHTKKDDLLVKYKKNFTKFTEKYEQEEAILEKIEDMGTIKIIEAKDVIGHIGYLNKYAINNPATTLTIKNLDASKYLKYIGSTDIIFLNILPKFDEVYKKYESKFIKK